jgi:serine protease AprX
MPSSGANFDLRVYDPSDRLVATSATRARQEWVTFRPSRTGTYRLEVVAATGAGDYFLDVSAGSEAPLQVVE